MRTRSAPSPGMVPLAAAATTAALLGLAACGSGSSRRAAATTFPASTSAASSSTSSTSVPSTVIPSSTTGAVTTESAQTGPTGIVPSTVTSGRTPRCRAAELEVGLGPPTALSASQHQVHLVFTNQASTACTLAGFPSVDLLGPKGADDVVSLAQQQRPTGTTVLQVGESAHAVITYLLGPDEACDRNGAWVPVSLRTIPPGDTTPLTIRWTPDESVDDCQRGATHPGSYVGPVESGL